MNRLIATIIISLAGVSLIFGASPKKKAATPAVNVDEVIAQARQALAEYRFEDVQELMNTYYKHLKDTPEAADAKALQHAGEMGDQMLERVEQIVVIDSVIVPKETFFKAYRLSPQAGSFEASKDAGNSPLYITQSGLTKFFATDHDGSLAVASARVLADGSVENPRIYPTAEGLDDAAYPFLMPDGLTLYFGATGDLSLGGYDIFITRRGSVDDDFLQPQNVGMPFNSPYDDYLLVIDEATGIGWWATDRNQIPDKLTIYMYVPSELRTNLSTELDDLADLAFIRSVAATQPAGFVKPDIDALVQKATPSTSAPEFQFALPGGRIITSVSQLSSGRSRELMKDYLEAQQQLEADRVTLADLRLRYGKGDTSLANRIVALENSVAKQTADLANLANEIVKAEK